jgi:translation initiation factor 2 alpha subunit (eIF-2alpha)
LKRVREFDTQSKMKEYKKGIKAEKMLKLLADKLNLNLDKVKLEIVNEIEEKIGSVFDAFQMSLTPQGYDLLIRKGIKEEIVQAIKAIAEENLKIKEKGIRKIIEIRCYKSDGINIIKNVLTNAKKTYDIDIKYISAPKYSLTLKTKNAKSGERKVKEASEHIIEKIQEFGGEGKVE